MRIAHDTLTYQIESASKSQLLDALVEHKGEDRRNELKRLKKSELREVAEDAISKERERKQVEDERKEAERLAILDIERHQHRTKHAYSEIEQVLDRVRQRLVADVSEFQTQVSQGIWECSHTLMWKGKSVLETIEKLRVITPLHNYFKYQVDDPKHTLNEVRDHLEFIKENALRSVLSDGYRHNSTCEMTNIHNKAEFGAKQFEYELVCGIEKSFHALLEKEIERAWIFVRGVL